MIKSPKEFHDCDTTGGSSGGPILAEIEGNYFIIALNWELDREPLAVAEACPRVKNYELRY